MNSLMKEARQAGAVYLSLAIFGPFSLIYVPAKLIVRGNAAATASNIANHETLFRVGIVADLFASVLFICAAMALYRLLCRVNRMWALLMLGLVLVSAAVGFLNVLNNVAALTLFRGETFLSVLDKPQREALGMLFLRLYGNGNYINELFWGFWLLPLGLLVFQSGFLPRFIGIWLVVNCFGYVTLSLIALLSPQYYGAAFRWAQPVLFGELALILWLLIKGAKVPPTNHSFAGEAVSFPEKAAPSQAAPA